MGNRTILVRSDYTADAGGPFRNAAVGDTLVDGAGTPIATAGWVTAMDLDFTAEGSQTLSSDTTYTIGGKTWTKINSARDRVAAAVTNGSGLILQPKGGGADRTNFQGADRTAPGITIPLTSIYSAVQHSTRLSAWMYFSAQNFTANYDFICIAFENPATGAKSSIGAFKGFSTTVQVWSQANYNNANVLNTAHGTDTTNNVVVIEAFAGLHSLQAVTYAGVWSSGWPTRASLLPRERITWTASDVSAIGAIGSWNLIITAGRIDSATSLSVTVAQVKVEYMP